MIVEDEEHEFRPARMRKWSCSVIALPFSIMAGNFSGVRIIRAIIRIHFFIYLLK